MYQWYSYYVRTSPALMLPQCTPCTTIPRVLQRMHHLSAPCSIHQQLPGRSILKVTGGELSSVIVKERGEDRERRKDNDTIVGGGTIGVMLMKCRGRHRNNRTQESERGII